MLQAIRWCIGLFAVCFALAAHAGALEEITQSAEHGDVEAQAKLGFIYIKAKDLPNAFKWCRKAAEQGDKGGMLCAAKLAFHFADDTGVMKSGADAVASLNAEGIKWYRKLAENGDAEAQFTLGGEYILGKRVKQDLAEGITLICKAKKQGNKDAEKVIQKSKATCS